MIKRQERQLEPWWRKPCDESDKAQARSNLKAYPMVIMAAKKQYLPATIASIQYRLYSVQQEEVASSAACCNHFAKHVVDIVSHIHSTTGPDGLGVLICPVARDTFLLVQYEDADKILGNLRSTTSL